MCYNVSQARTDPNFKLGETSLGAQVFCNAVAMPRPRSSEETDLMQASTELPTHASSISTTDGYLPTAMLFVDEEFMQHRCARESRLSMLCWRPTVRFCSNHYKYIKDDAGLRIVQVGIGATESHFPKPPEAAAPGRAKRP